MNYLYYGDNLDVLRRHIKDESVDLVYLDPPFNSKATYNVLFSEHNGTKSAAQAKAFEDTWIWSDASARVFQETIESPGKTSELLRAFMGFLGPSNMMAYLTMMAPRLVELRRVLRPNGSIYLHCDPTASHYLKLLLDAVFGLTNLLNEIVWKRSHPKGLTTRRFARNHDVILSYARDVAQATWNHQYLPHEKASEQYASVDETGRRYQLTSLLNPNPDRPNLTYEFKGVTRVWRWTKERVMEEDAKGRIVVPRGGKGIPRYKRYLDEQEGVPLGDFWADVDFAAGKERLGYPTQKPLSLLERIIEASSNPGEVVLDPFCGCGTAVVAAEQLGRSWIGIDITQAAMVVIKRRLRDAFEGRAKHEVVGEPVSLPDAATLAANDPYQFQWWALGLVDARPAETKKGADRGIDGRLYFHDEGPSKTKQVIFSVKAGHVTASHVRDLRGVVERERAQIGVLISMEPPTRDMRREAASSGFYESPWANTKHPRMQLLTVADLLAGRKVDCPRAEGMNVTYKRAPRAKGRRAKQLGLGLTERRPE